MDIQQQLEDAKKEMIDLLLEEITLIDGKIDKVDDIRTQLLNTILELRLQYDGVVKKLDLLGHDTSAL